MTRFIIIPADGTQLLTRTELNGLDDLQRAVGGWIEQVTVTDSLVLLVDEEGRMKRRAINRRATLLFRLLFPAARQTLAIVGDVIVAGAPTNESFSDTPTEIEQLLIDTRRYAVRATFHGRDVWSTPFDDFWEASEVAIVADMTETLQNVTVVPFE